MTISSFYIPIHRTTGALAQANLTFCRNRSLKEIVDEREGRAVPLEEYRQKVQLFFSPTTTAKPAEAATCDVSSGVPLHWKPIYAITDQCNDAVVVTFDTNKCADF